MKYLGFKMPDIAWDGLDWVYDLVEDRGWNKAYLINAKNPDNAREKLFDELYNSNDYEELAVFYMHDLAESFDEDEVFEDFGKTDGKIILEILDDFQDLLEKGEKKLPFYDERLTLISSQTIRKMAFLEMRHDLGIIKIEKELK